MFTKTPGQAEGEAVRAELPRWGGAGHLNYARGVKQGQVVVKRFLAPLGMTGEKVGGRQRDGTGEGRLERLKRRQLLGGAGRRSRWWAKRPGDAKAKSG